MRSDLEEKKKKKKDLNGTNIIKNISMPALGYAKIAIGIEVQVNSKLIPKELLPVEPLEHYDIPYEFLKSEPSKK
jgi:hypothetical protein